MSMDQENLELQRRLHEQNQQRMQEFENQQRKQGEVLIEIAANTKCIPQLVERVDDLEASRDKQKGAMVIIGSVWGLLETYLHTHNK